MPRNARIVAPGIPYHITQRGTDRANVFFTIADRHLYLRLIRENLAEAEVRILAYCLMTNHVHLVVIPEREDSLSALFQRVHGRFAQAINIRRGRSGHFWQQRFFSCPLSPSHLWVAMQYVEQNPCRAGIATQPEDYRWSSARAHLGLGGDTGGILDLDFWRTNGGADSWQSLLRESLTTDAVVSVRKSTYAGRPFGDQKFLSEMSMRFQRNWRAPKAVSTLKIGVSSEKSHLVCPSGQILKCG